MVVQPQAVALHAWVVGSQHSPAVQSESLQQPTQAPLQHTWLPLHCDAVVQPQAVALHACVSGSQHSPAVQSESLQHPTQALLQHTWLALHSALVVQPQAAALHVCVERSQHVPPTQSPLEQQLPFKHTGTAIPASDLRASAFASGIRTFASLPVWPDASDPCRGFPASEDRVVASIPASLPETVDPPLPHAASTRPSVTT